MKKKIRGGFTLTETAISMVVASIVLATLPFIVDSFVHVEKRVQNKNYSQVYGLFDDVIYSATIAKNVDVGGFLKITRYDGCTVRYDYYPDEKKIDKSLACGNGSGGHSERNVVVGNVKEATFADNGDGTYSIFLKLEDESDDMVHKLTFKGL